MGPRSRGGFPACRKSRLRSRTAQRRDRLAVFLLRAPAEKSTTEQPIGKRTSLMLSTKRSAAGGGGVAPAARASSAPPKIKPTNSPTTTCAAAPPHRRWLTQPTPRPRHPYSIPLMTATSVGERSPPPPPVIARASSVPLWNTREISNASGPETNPRRPITGARALTTAVPTARPAQTKTDHETFRTRSATNGFRPSASPRAPPSASSSTSMTRPRMTANQAARRSVAPRSGAGSAACALLVCSDSCIAIISLATVYPSGLSLANGPQGGGQEGQVRRRAQVLVDRLDGDRARPHSGGNPLDRPVPDVARREDARNARLEHQGRPSERPSLRAPTLSQ